MIYVVEFPREARPTAWFAFEKQDFIRKVEARNVGEKVILDVATPRQQLAALGGSTDSPTARSKFPAVFELADRYGWDTELYRADYVFDEGVYQPDPVSELEAYAAAIGHDLEACRVYLSDQAATQALYQDPLYNGREGFYAHIALRDQLIAMEVISDDM